MCFQCLRSAECARAQEGCSETRRTMLLSSSFVLLTKEASLSSVMIRVKTMRIVRSSSTSMMINTCESSGSKTVGANHRQQSTSAAVSVLLKGRCFASKYCHEISRLCHAIIKLGRRQARIPPPQNKIHGLGAPADPKPSLGSWAQVPEPGSHLPTPPAK